MIEGTPAQAREVDKAMAEFLGLDFDKVVQGSMIFSWGGGDDAPATITWEGQAQVSKLDVATVLAKVLHPRG